MNAGMAVIVSCAPPERGARMPINPVGARRSATLPTGYLHPRLRRASVNPGGGCTETLG